MKKLKFDEISFEPIEDLLKVRAGKAPADGDCGNGCATGGSCGNGCPPT